MANTAAQAATQATGLSTLSTLLSDEGTRVQALETILSGLLAGINELLQPQREFWISLAVTLDNLSMSEAAVDQGLAAAVIQLCAMPGPEDLPPPGEVFAPSEEGVELGISGALGEEGLPLEVVIATREEGSTMTIRAGGWLLCALTEGDVEVDGEPLWLGDAEALDARIDVSAWPQPVEGAQEPPSAAQVTLTLELSHEVLLPILSAEEVTLWLVDEPIDLFPRDSEATASLRRHLEGLLGLEPEEGEPGLEEAPVVEDEAVEPEAPDLVIEPGDVEPPA